MVAESKCKGFPELGKYKKVSRHFRIAKGGRNGVRLHVTAGDVIIIPAGVGHFGVDGSDDYEIVGGYPDGRVWNIMFGSEAERKLAFLQISTVPVPSKDRLMGITVICLVYSLQ